jgi:hypothetical protein
MRPTFAVTGTGDAGTIAGIDTDRTPPARRHSMHGMADFTIFHNPN